MKLNQYLVTVADWGNMERVVRQTRAELFKHSDEFFKHSTELFKHFTKLWIFFSAFKNSAQCLESSSVLLKRVYENLVCKKHHIFMPV